MEMLAHAQAVDTRPSFLLSCGLGLKLNISLSVTHLTTLYYAQI